MRRIGWSLVLLALAGALQAEPQVPRGWKRYRLAGNPVLSVAFPTSPEAKSQTEAAFNVTVYASRDTHGVYLAEVGSTSDDIPPSQTQAAYDMALKSFRTSFAHEAGRPLVVVGRRRTAMSGRVGQEETYTCGAAQGCARVFVVGRHSFYLLASFTQGSSAFVRLAHFE